MVVIVISTLESSKCAFVCVRHPRLRSRHCVSHNEPESATVSTCEGVDRDYDVPLRIGLLFVVLVTSGIGTLLQHIRPGNPLTALQVSSLQSSSHPFRSRIARIFSSWS